MEKSSLDDVHIIQEGNNYKFMVNGVDIGENYCIDDMELAKALSYTGDFYPFTCNCGIPECAELYEPVYCTVTEDKMVWHKKYPAPEEIFAFDRKKVLEELERILSDIFNKLYDKYCDCPGYDTSFPYGPFGTSLASLKQALELCREQLNIKKKITDHEIRHIDLSAMLENNCTPEELIPALKIGNIHATPGMANEEPIHVAACYNSHNENIDLLLVRGADINVKDEYEETPLFHAVKGRYPEKMIPHLLFRGADIEARNDYKQTPFLTALDYLDDPIRVVTILKNHGCDIFAKDQYGNGALNYAERRKLSEDVIELLISWGCR